MKFIVNLFYTKQLLVMDEKQQQIFFFFKSSADNANLNEEVTRYNLEWSPQLSLSDNDMNDAAN